MRRALASLRAAFAYFSVLPAGRAEGPPGPGTLAALPLVGAVTGGLAGAIALAASLVVPAPIAVALAFALSLALTGAIHVDGFLDACDALFASATPSRRLDILTDPRHGTFAVAGMAALAALWLAALWAIAPPALPGIMAFAAALGRASAVLCAFAFPYARPDAPPALEARPPVLPVVLIFGVLAALSVLAGPWAWTTVLGGPLLALALGAVAARKLGGGITGDVYGFAEVVTEVAVLVTVASLRAAT